MKNMRPYLAELAGTFLLTLVVRLAIGSQFPVATPVLAGLTVGLLVYVFGPVSGTHINPAVTVGLLAVKKIAPVDGLMYIVFQLVGATAAGVAGTAIMGTPLSFEVGTSLSIGFAEALGAAVLLLGISSVAWGKTPSAASGLVIGTGLTVGVHVASVLSFGILNPAVALGIGSLSIAYLVGPLVGAVIATLGYRWLAS